MSDESPVGPAGPPCRIVHEGRGGFIDIDGVHFPIEHTGDGRFCIHTSGAQLGRHPDRARHLTVLRGLVAGEPGRWSLSGA